MKQINPLLKVSERSWIPLTRRGGPFTISVWNSYDTNRESSLDSPVCPGGIQLHLLTHGKTSQKKTFCPRNSSSESYFRYRTKAFAISKSHPHHFHDRIFKNDRNFFELSMRVQRSFCKCTQKKKRLWYDNAYALDFLILYKLLLFTENKSVSQILFN